MSEVLYSAINSVLNSQGAFCRFITANDTHASGSHQSGFLIPIGAYSLFFNKKKKKGENEDIFVRVKWFGFKELTNRITYYGKEKNELRITRFGRGFPFFEDNYVGDLLIMAKHTDDYYECHILSTEDEIESFITYFNLSIEQRNQIIDISKGLSEEELLQSSINAAIINLQDFPQTKEMGLIAQNIYNQLYKIKENDICKNPDKILLKWYDTEHTLFRTLEEKIYRPIYTEPFTNCQSLIDFSNTILNRRKSRAGKSLEHHLSTIFTNEKLIFEEQVVTENNKKPDFLFPNRACYIDYKFPSEYITILGAKTTCKDRWRQVINEAARVDERYLFTLQQGISKNQLCEMADEHVILVVPKSHIDSFPEEYRNRLNTLSRFISIVKEKQEHMPKHYLLF